MDLFSSFPKKVDMEFVLQQVCAFLEKQDGYLEVVSQAYGDRMSMLAAARDLGTRIALLTEEQKKLASMQATFGTEVFAKIDTYQNTAHVSAKAAKNEVIAEIQKFSNLCESFSKHEAFVKRQASDFETTQKQITLTFAGLMEKYASSINKTANENLKLREEVKRVKKALSVADTRVLDLEQGKLFPEPSPTEPYELIDLETGEQTSVVPRQLPAPVKAKAAEDDLKNKEKGERDEMRELIEAVMSKLESLEERLKGMPLDAASEQPQEPLPTAPTGRSVPTEAPPVAPALPAPVVMQASNGFVPKADDLLSYPNAAQLGKKSLSHLEEVAGVLDRKSLFVFDLDTVRGVLNKEVATCYRHLGTWEQLGFIEKQANGRYRFLPPATTTTAATPTQPQAEDSQPAEGG